MDRRPFVCAVLLTRDRHELTARAISAFRAQTYQPKALLLWDNGDRRYPGHPLPGESFCVATRRSIGEMRNDAIRSAITGRAPAPDIFVTWDSDDWSHPRRIEEQVALLLSTGADIVGYRDLLFRRGAESWLYRSPTADYGPGTTLAYWRRTWQARQYPALSVQEDYEFQLSRNVATESSIKGEPRMIASIHGANSQQASYDRILGAVTEFRRAPEWDRYQEEKWEKLTA